jgi:hypothetical protein
MLSINSTPVGSASSSTWAARGRDKVGYRGFTPIEALGEGDPAAIVTAFLNQVRKAVEA